MILRVFSAVALLAGVTLLLAYLQIVGEGPFASEAQRHLRTMKERTARPARVEAADTAAFLALPHGAPLATVAALERRAVVVEGRVQRMLWASDGDVHLEVAGPAADLDDPDRRATAPYLTAEVTPAFRRRHPGWRYEALAAALRPNLGSPAPWPGGPCRARVTGWLCYDFQYDEPVTAEQIATGAPRLTGWEIHPVTRLEVWDDARGDWREVGP